MSKKSLEIPRLKVNNPLRESWLKRPSVAFGKVKEKFPQTSVTAPARLTTSTIVKQNLTTRRQNGHTESFKKESMLGQTGISRSFRQYSKSHLNHKSDFDLKKIKQQLIAEIALVEEGNKKKELKLEELNSSMLALSEAIESAKAHKEELSTEREEIESETKRITELISKKIEVINKMLIERDKVEAAAVAKRRKRRHE